MSRTIFVAELPEPGRYHHLVTDKTGTPSRALACECRVRLVDEVGGTCAMCGKHAEAEISRTWDVAA